MLRCSTCHLKKPVASFWKNVRSATGRQNECKDCKSARAKRDRLLKIKADPSFVRSDSIRSLNNAFKRKLKAFGLTVEDYDRLTASGCTICSGPARGRGRFHIDHDHATGRFRGFLCTCCNVALGLLKDDTKLLKKVITYLRKHQA